MIVLINPNLVAQKNDLFTTGIVYMPVGLAYFAGVLRKRGYDFKVIDAYGEKPLQIKANGDFLIMGLSEEEIIGLLPQDIEVIFIYASNVSYHMALINIVKAIKDRRSEVPIVAMENTQAVTAYSLEDVQEELYRSGVDFILTGEPEVSGMKLIEAFIKGGIALQDIAGLGYQDNGLIHYNPPETGIEDLDKIPFPAWDCFPLNNYWQLRFSHGPFESQSYLPILTSRGCPYDCGFCLMPDMSQHQWRGRSACNLVDEMEYSQRRYGVSEFHFEDVNPTVSEERIRKICQEILKRNLKVIWKLASGTKVETIKSEDTIELMAQAGCNYISISPEAGSVKVLKLMNKPFDLQHAVNIIKKMHSCRIFSQACFVLGFPGETPEDLKLTENLVKQLTKAGVDEVAIFIITPVPGSRLFAEFKGYYNFSQLNFSPAWRKDYAFLNRKRIKLYLIFMFYKFIFHFPKIAIQPWRFLRQSFKTKMEMIPYRVFIMKFFTKRFK